MITLLKNKIIHTNEYGAHSDKYVRKEVDYLLPYLEDVVEFGDDFTLGDLFNYLEREPTLELVFISALGSFPLQLFIDDMKKFAEDEGDKLDYLELRRYGERWEHSGEIDLSINFSGVSNTQDIHYAIEFTSLYVLKDLPLRLNTEFSISEIKCPSRIVRFFIRLLKKVCIKRWDNPFSYTYVKGTTCFSVYELISTVLSEISFVGDPEMRDKKIAEIVRETDEMMEEYSNGE